MSERVLKKLLQAEVAVNHLLGMGVEVSHVDISEARPRIWLRGKDESLRALFTSGIHLIRPAAHGGRETVMAAPFQGCQLQWGVQQ